MKTTKTEAAETSRVFQAARLLGAAAFAKGMNRVPALDADLRAMMAAEPYQISDPRCLARLDGWIRGWDVANLAAPID